jgi:hypothetical protein
MPSTTLASGRQSGIKIDKKRITLAFIVNATGTETVNPIVIGHNKNPHCFKGWKPNTIVSYYYNSNAWMTMEILDDYGSLKELTNTDDFIDLEKSETIMPMLSDNQIVNIYKNVEEKDEEEKGEEELVHEEIKIPSTKEAIEAFNVLSRFIENSKSYNDNQIELLKNVNDCILDISAEKLQQKNLFDFFKKV